MQSLNLVKLSKLMENITQNKTKNNSLKPDKKALANIANIDLINKPLSLTGAQIIVKALIEEGVDTIFGYPGGAILPFYDALFMQNKIHHILNRHEQASTHAAEGYARSTGKVGVITVTSGPGATNAITGLTDAYMDSIPLVCISGQVATSIIGTDGFQEADVTGLTRSCTKYNYLVKDVNDLGNIIHEAFHIARTNRPGPVLIDIPKDVQNAHGKYLGKPSTINRQSYKVLKQQVSIDHSQIDQAVELMKNAQRPVFYVGGGLINSGQKACELLRQLVKATGFPITQTLMGLGAFPTSDHHFLGMLGMHGTFEANMAMYECDVMINLGARFDDRVTGRVSGFSPNSKKIHVDIDQCSINKIIQVDVGIVGDAENVLEAMLDKWRKLKNVKQDNTKEWWQKIAKWRDIKSLSYENCSKTIKPEYAIERLNALTKDQKPFVSTDVGQHQMWSAQYITFDEPKKWLTSGGLGTMGYGVPSALGAQVANPQSLVICVSGDASFMMNMQELATLKQYNLPVKIFILNNRYMGMVRQWQELIYEKRESQSYMESLPDFVLLAQSFGILGIECDNPQNLDQKILQMINHQGPVLFNCIVDKSENVFPMIPAGSAHNEILLGSQAKSYVTKDINAV